MPLWSLRIGHLGFAFGLPDYLMPGGESSAVTIRPGDKPDTIHIISNNVNLLFPGVEGKFKLVLERQTGFPQKLVVFGLDEWQGVPRGGFKLLIKFEVYPGCRPAS